MKKLVSIIAIVLVICMLASCTGPVVTPNDETTAGKTTEATTVAPTETTEAPAPETTKAPVIETTEAPAPETTEAPVVETTEAPVVETTEAPAVETTDAPAIETTEAPVVETTEAPVTETTEAPVTETTEAPADETTEEVTDKVVENDHSKYPAPPPPKDDEDETTGGIGGGFRPDVPSWEPEYNECNHDFDENYIVINAELVVPEGNCLDGVRITFKCMVCGAEKTVDDYSGVHTVVSANKVDLSEYENVCEDHQFYLATCVCGLASYITSNEIDGKYEEIYDEEGYFIGWTESCGSCDVWVRAEAIEGEVGEYCQVVECEVEQLYVGEELVAESVWYEYFTQHSYKETTALVEGATSCLDGVYVIRECQNCGVKATDTKYYHYYANDSDAVDLSGYDVCSDHVIGFGGCACGQMAGYFDKGMTYYNGYNGDDRRIWCENCGLTVVLEYASYNEPISKNEECYTIWEVFATVSLGDEIITTRETTYGSTEHEFVYDNVLLEGSVTCEDGVLVVATCAECGYILEYETDWHSGMYTYFDLSEYDVCPEHKPYYNICACERESFFYMYNCYAQYEENYTMYWCEDCGLYMEATFANRTEKDETCTVFMDMVLKVGVGDEEVYTIEGRYSEFEHNCETTCELAEGVTSCEDGLLVTETCVDCDYTYTWTWNWHYTTIEYVDMSEYNVCEDHEIRYQFCPCGAESRLIVDGSFAIKYEGDVRIETCDDCDLVIRVTVFESEKDGCSVTEKSNYDICIGEDIVYSFVGVDTSSRHNIVAEVVLFEGATSCEDGVYITQMCADCGVTVWEREAYSHEPFVIGKVDLSLFDICDKHAISESGCACGLIKDHMSTNISNSYTNWDEEKETSYASCPDCGLRVYVYDLNEDVAEGCEKITYSRFEYYVYGGEEVVHIGDFYTTHQTVNHNCVYEFEFLGENENCEEGVIIYEVCRECGHSSSWEKNSHEPLWYTVDFSGYDVCREHVAEYAICPCGYSGYFWDIPETNNEYTSNGYVFSCDDCGLKAVNTYGDESEKDENCEYVREETVTITVNDEPVTVLEYGAIVTSHEYKNSVKLAEGSVTCLDGMILTRDCIDCGNHIEKPYKDHRTVQVVIDGGVECPIFTNHGIIINECACGEISTTSIYNMDGSMGRDEDTYDYKYSCTHCDLIIYVTYEEVDEGTKYNCEVYNGETFVDTYTFIGEAPQKK